MAALIRILRAHAGEVLERKTEEMTAENLAAQLVADVSKVLDFRPRRSLKAALVTELRSAYGVP